MLNYASNSISELTQEVETGIENHYRLTISDVFCHWINQNRQIATNVIHHEQENADRCRTHLEWYDFNQNSKHNSKPHFSCKKRFFSF